MATGQPQDYSTKSRSIMVYVGSQLSETPTAQEIDAHGG